MLDDLRRRDDNELAALVADKDLDIPDLMMECGRAFGLNLVVAGNHNSHQTAPTLSAPGAAYFSEGVRTRASATARAAPGARRVYCKLGTASINNYSSRLS